MKTKRIHALWLTAAAVLLTVPRADAQCSIVSTGFQGPVGIVQLDTGDLLVSESGSPVPNTGRISLVNHGHQQAFLSGLPSGINDVGSSSGPQGLFVRGRTLYVAISVGDAAKAGPVPGSIVANPVPSSPIFSSVLAVHLSSREEDLATGFTLTFANQQALASGRKVTLSNGRGDKMIIELVVNFPNSVPKPFPGVPANIAQSNPFGLVAVDDQLYVTDGGQNKLWQIDLPTGSYRTLTDFPDIPNPLFPGLGGPVEEAVPTGIAYSRGRLLVTLFRGVPFAQGTSAVEQVDPVNGSHVAILSGLTSAVDIKPVRDLGRTKYLVLQFASVGPFFGGPGLVLGYASLGSPGATVANCLTFPTSMTLDQETGILYVTELGGDLVAVRFGQDRVSVGRSEDRVSSNSLAQTAAFTTIDFPGASINSAQGINPRGDIVGQYVTLNPLSVHGYLLHGGKFASIDFPGANFSLSRGINPRGDIVGQYVDPKSSFHHGYLLSRDSFTTFDFPGATETFAFGINPDGDIVGLYTTAGVAHGFQLSGGTFASIDFPGASSTFAWGINSEGDIVGQYTSAGVTHGFLFRRGSFTTIDFPGASLTAALGNNSEGDIVGQYTIAGVTHGFRWSEGEFVSIDFPGASSSMTRGINSEGDIIGQYTIAGVTHGFLLSGDK